MRLLSLLITLAIIGFLVWNFSLKPLVSGTGTETVPGFRPEQLIDEAKRVKELIQSSILEN